MDEKTNVMRLLDRAKIVYESHSYTGDETTSGEQVAALVGKPPERVFKTLVTVGKSGKNYVFVIPVNRELDLKKAAYSVSEKSVQMIKAKELLPLTGYIHGGCSPIGMKKQFVTAVDTSAMEYETFLFSAGKIGCQVEMNPEDLQRIIAHRFADLT